MTTKEREVGDINGQAFDLFYQRQNRKYYLSHSLDSLLYISMLARLAEAKISSLSKGPGGWTPLNFAAKSGFVEVAQILLKKNSASVD